MKYYPIEELEEYTTPLLKNGERLPVVSFHVDTNEIYFKGKKVGTGELNKDELTIIELNNDFIMNYGFPFAFILPYSLNKCKPKVKENE
jgi:hypothetical protein